MKNFLIIFIALATSLTAMGQLPQFTSSDHDYWSYNNPNVPLSDTNIASGRVTLYVTSEGLVLTLTSDTFACHDIDSIKASVVWYTKFFTDPNFDLNKASLTLAIDDADGNPQDSVTCVPTATGTSNHTLTFSLPVPRGMNTARLRLLSWTGNVVSSGAIKRALFTAVTTQDEVVPGDVDGSGSIDIADVTLLIDYVLNGLPSDVSLKATDVNGDGDVSIEDITLLIDMVLNAA